MRLKQEAKRHPFIKEMMEIAKTWEKFVPTNKKYRRKKILDHAIFAGVTLSLQRVMMIQNPSRI